MKKNNSNKSYIDDDGEVAELDAEWFENATLVIPPKKPPRISISLRVDPDVVAAYKSLGPGYQSRMNAMLAAGAKKILAIGKK